MTPLCSDNFNGSNTGNFNGRALNNGLGGAASATWVVTGNPFGIVDNEAASGGYAAYALVSNADVVGIRALITTATTNNRAALVAHCDSGMSGPAVAFRFTSDSEIAIREFNTGDFSGPDRAWQSIDPVDADTLYVMQLVRSGSVFTGTLYDADGVTVIGTVSYDFGATAFAGDYWGITNYVGENIKSSGVIFYEADSPPAGNALIQLMQHGQLTGGLL